MEQLMWVKIETTKGNDDVWSFKGQVLASVFENIVCGKLTSGFFKMTEVYWFTSKYDEHGNSIGKELIQYGKGKLKAYRGDFYSRVEHLVSIAPIDGAREIADYETREGKHLNVVANIRS